MVVSNPAKLSSVISEFEGGNCLSGNITAQGDGLTCLSEFAGLSASSGETITTNLDGTQPGSTTYSHALTINGSARQSPTTAEQLACQQANGFSSPPTFGQCYTVDVDCENGNGVRSTFFRQSDFTTLPSDHASFANGRGRIQLQWWNYNIGDFLTPIRIQMYDESQWDFNTHLTTVANGTADGFADTNQTVAPGNTFITPGAASAPTWFTELVLTDHVGRTLTLPADQFNYLGAGLSADGQGPGSEAKALFPAARTWAWYAQQDSDWGAFNPSLSGGAPNDNQGTIPNPGDFQWPLCTATFNGYGG